MPDWIPAEDGIFDRHPETSIALFPGFRLVGRNDTSLRDNQKLASPEDEGFQPSPSGTLKPARGLPASGGRTRPEPLNPEP